MNFYFKAGLYFYKIFIKKRTGHTKTHPYILAIYILRKHVTFISNSYCSDCDPRAKACVGKCFLSKNKILHKPKGLEDFLKINIHYCKMSSDKITFTYIYDKVPLVTGKQVQRLERKGDITSHILCCIGGDDMIDAEFKNDEFNKQTVINLIIQKLYIQYGIQLIGSTNGGNNEELTSALN